MNIRRPIHHRNAALWLVIAPLGDRRIKVIDPHFLGHNVEPLEGMTVASQPRFDALVAHSLSIPMTA
jgi:hypothetical protein